MNGSIQNVKRSQIKKDVYRVGERIKIHNFRSKRERSRCYGFHDCTTFGMVHKNKVITLRFGLGVGKNMEGSFMKELTIKKGSS